MLVWVYGCGVGKVCKREKGDIRGMRLRGMGI